MTDRKKYTQKDCIQLPIASRLENGRSSTKASFCLCRGCPLRRAEMIKGVVGVAADAEQHSLLLSTKKRASGTLHNVRFFAY